jgi:hypothetical protein
VRITVITVGEEGDSHFADGELPLTAQPFAPPAPPLEVSDPIPADRGVFSSMAPGWFGDWHPTPCRQYFVQTSGELEVQVSDGEVRRFRTGAVVLLEDTTGRGHTTRVVSADPVHAVFLQLPPE